MQSSPKTQIELRILTNRIRQSIDKLALHSTKRWAFFCVMLILLILRVVILDAYHAILYLYGFYLLQNLIKYVTPSQLPTIQEEEEMEETVYDIPETTPVEKNDDESKPMIRRLSEFNLW